jgi:hypothetical protein
MSKRRSPKVRKALCAAVTTVGATCGLPVAAPAQAAGCDSYVFPAAPAGAPAFEGFAFNVELVQNNDIHVYLQTTGNEVRKAMYVKPFAPPLVGETFIGGVRVTGGEPNPAAIPVLGSASGGLKGRAIDFKVRWENEFTNVYTGQVNDDGGASGTTANNTGAPNTWHSAFADFTCAPTRTLGKQPAAETSDGRTLGRLPVGDSLPLPGVLPSTPATVAADVDVYNAKNEPDGAGQVVGVLRAGKSVNLAGSCAPNSWCEVSGDSVPTGHGWVWGHLELP